MNSNIMNRRIMKRQSRMLLKLQRGKFLKLNLFSIILNIVYYSSINYAAYYIMNNFTVNEITKMSTAGGILSATPRQQILIMGFELFAAMIKIGVQYTMIDFLFDAGDKELKHPFADSTSVFSHEYFLSVMTMWLASYLLIQFGSMLFIIPGLYFYLIFSQIFFVYKHGRSDNLQLGLIATFTASNILMRGFRIKYLLLVLSFLGWDILNILTCGLLSFWLIPYKNMTYTLFYKNLVQIKNEGLH